MAQVENVILQFSKIILGLKSFFDFGLSLEEEKLLETSFDNKSLLPSLVNVRDRLIEVVKQPILKTVTEKTQNLTSLIS